MEFFQKVKVLFLNFGNKNSLFALEAINKLRNLNLDGERDTERNDILNLLKEYCKSNNKIASLFTTVDALSNNADKDARLYKGVYHKYTRDYPFLYQELQNKKENVRYKSKIKEIECK
mgnify:CR=1 FL=1